MAFLRSLSLAALLVSCHGGSEGGVLEAERYEFPVECDEDGRCTRAGTWSVVAAPPLEGFAFVTTEAGDDLLVYGELPLGGPGSMAVIELELPRAPDEPSVTYVERLAGEESFRSARAVGYIEIPHSVLQDDCWCETGRLELQLTDPGADGILDTEDDAIRHLSAGRFTSGEEFCVDAQGLQFEPGELELRRVDRCPERFAPSAPPSPPREPEPYTPSSSSTSCDADLSGCGDASCDGGGSGGGCDGGGGGCDGDSSASCDGDSSGSCDGGGDTTCTGDGALVPACRIPRGCGPLGDGRFQLVLFLAIILVDLRRRAGLTLGRDPILS